MKEPREDPRLLALAALAREEASDAVADPRWDELAAGTISAEDRRALDDLAARSPEAEGAPALFAPLGAAAESRFADAILAQITADRGAVAPAPRAADARPKVAARSASPPRARSSSRWIAIGSGLAMAAGFALFLALRPTTGPANEALPAFETVFVRGVKEQRGADDGEPIRVRAGAVITAAVRPAMPVKGPIAARAWLTRGASAVALATTFELSDDGAVRLVARFGSAQAIDPGAADLVIAVCRPEALPAELRDVPSACRALRRSVVIERE
ncbi:MAG: hypothetical protein ABJE95_35390 [Byssovorax sp.]